MQDNYKVNPEIIEERVQNGLRVLNDCAKWKSYDLRNKGVSLSKDELISIGYFGLRNAAEIFDIEKSSDFKAFARYQINLAILQYQRDMDVLDHRVRIEINEILKVRENLTQNLSRIPTAKEIADKLNRDEDEIHSLLSRDPKHTDINDEYIERSIPIPISNDFEDKTSEESLGQDMSDCIDTVLKSQQKKIIKLLYFDEKTAEEVALIVKQRNSREEITFVYNTTKSCKLKLKKCMEKKGWSITDV